MHPENFIPVLSGSFAAILAYFVVVLCIDIALGVVRSLLALARKPAATALSVRSFDWTFLGSFARTQLMSPPVIAVVGAIALATIAPGATKQSIIAVASAAALTQSLMLTRDVFNKTREVAALLSFLPFNFPGAK